MMLSDFYKFARIPLPRQEKIFFWTYRAIASTGGYEVYEHDAAKNTSKELFTRLTYMPYDLSKLGTKQPRMLFGVLSCDPVLVYTDVDYPLIGYGIYRFDYVCIRDAFLFQFSEDFKKVAVFIAKGRKSDVFELYRLFINGELNEEIGILKKQAKKLVKPNVTNNVKLDMITGNENAALRIEGDRLSRSLDPFAKIRDDVRFGNIYDDEDVEAQLLRYKPRLFTDYIDDPRFSNDQ